MKKQVVLLAVAALFSGQVWAAPETVLEKTDALENSIYGSTQVGALVDRVNQISQTVFGKQSEGTITSRVDSLYGSIANSSQGHVSVEQQLAMLEWSYQNKVESGSLVSRVEHLERSVNGRIETGALESRIQTLSKTINGKPLKLTSQVGTINNTEVFSVTLDTAISTKSNKVGDTFDFTVADDIMDGNVLLVPAGTMGTGHISEIKSASSFGRNGKLDLVFDSVETINGDTFTAIQGEEAKAKTKQELKAAGASVAGAVLLGPVGLVGGFFVKGKNIELPVGSTIYVQPQEVVTVQGIVVGGDGLPHGTSGSITEGNYDDYELGNPDEAVTLVPASGSSDAVTDEETVDHDAVDAADDSASEVEEDTEHQSVEEDTEQQSVEEDTEQQSVEEAGDTDEEVEESSTVASAPSQPIVVVKRN
ncbi:hypothetical protein [uncultured Veillonella sp.]|uniref:hypothetical protein n=1 Tax=uncultured Veillonella sp. TaxID=159268 RepID=UPI00261A9A19|nr:hypothetical protein [uncultured Veillonella sp.]